MAFKCTHCGHLYPYNYTHECKRDSVLKAYSALKAYTVPPFDIKTSELISWLDSLQDSDELRVIKTTGGGLALHSRLGGQLFWVKP